MTFGRAVLLDVDGTLVDALAGQRRIWRQWAVEFGVDPDLAYSVALRTRPVDTAAELLSGIDPAVAASRFDELEDHDALHGDLRAIDGAAALLAGLAHRAAGRWGLVTSNAQRRVATRFGRLGLPLPHVVVDNAATLLGKPAGDPYRRAAEQLGLAPADCLVIEDSPSGVAAGVAAGMTVWSVNTTEPVPGAHRHYRHLAEAVDDILDVVDGRADAASNADTAT